MSFERNLWKCCIFILFTYLTLWQEIRVCLHRALGNFGWQLLFHSFLHYRTEDWIKHNEAFLTKKTERDHLISHSLFLFCMIFRGMFTFNRLCHNNECFLWCAHCDSTNQKTYVDLHPEVLRKASQSDRKWRFQSALANFVCYASDSQWMDCWWFVGGSSDVETNDGLMLLSTIWNSVQYVPDEK